MYNKICDIKNKLVESLEVEIISKGVECADTEECGKVTDMIKDLAKAEKDCLEAEYYKTIIEAMEEESGEDYLSERMGYNRNRSASTGRYTSGRSGRSGSRGSRSQSGSMRMGYNDRYDLADPYKDDFWRYGDTEAMNKIHEYEDPRYGKAYNKWKMSKKHYHETGSQRDKEEMSESAKEHMTDTVMTLKEIWKEASPELRREMKMHLDNLNKDMSV